MYKIELYAGLGDCLRALNNCGVTYLCEKENTKCFVTYRGHTATSWQAENWKTFKTLIDCVDMLEYDCTNVDNNELKPIFQLRDENLKHPILPLKINITSESIENSLAEARYNVALHMRGSTAYKKINESTLTDLCDFFDKTSTLLHIVDHPGYYKQNAELLGGYKNVRLHNHNFPQNCKLLQNCDMLIAPDSFSKYVNPHTKKILLCTVVPYQTTERTFSISFKGIYGKDSVRILGAKGEDPLDLVSDVAEIPSSKVIAAVKDFLPF